MIGPLMDVHSGVLSVHGYTAMYKTIDLRFILQGLMTNILHLPTTQVAGRDQAPTFVCATPDMRQKYRIGYDPLERCTETGVTSFWVMDTTIVFLCPSFITTLRPQPAFAPGGPRDIYCPLVQNNAFVGQSDPLIKYQSYDLVHQLAHLYLQRHALTDQTVPKEVMDWNSCVGLGWRQYEDPSMRNPSNLVYYSAFVNQQCRQMPDPFRAPFLGPDDQTGLLSKGNSSGGSLLNSTDLRLQS